MTQSPQPTPSAAPPYPAAMADPLVLFRWLDVVLVVLAAPFVVLMGLPVLGYAVGAVAWIANRAIGVARRARRERARRTSAARSASTSAADRALVARGPYHPGRRAGRRAGGRADGRRPAARRLHRSTSSPRCCCARWKGRPRAHEHPQEDPARHRRRLHRRDGARDRSSSAPPGATTTSSSRRTSSSSTPGSRSRARSTSTRPCSTC